MKDKLNIGIVGTGFMGKAHNNAWLDAPFYFDLPYQLFRKVACDAIGDRVEAFAEQFGWLETTTSWETLVKRDDIQVIDICSSNQSHMPIAIEAARNGKHVICEEPIARGAMEARKNVGCCQTGQCSSYGGLQLPESPCSCPCQEDDRRGQDR